MDKNIVLKKMVEIGFNDKEAKIYLSALENSTSSVAKIAEGANLNRVTTYGILKKLAEKGLVSKTNIKGIKYFTAISPEILVDDIQKKSKEFNNILPFLQSISQNKDIHPTVRYFEGITGVKKSYMETLYSKTEILSYANSKNIRDHWPEYDQEYVQKRTDRKIFLKGLAPDDRQGKIVQNNDAKFYRQTKLLDKSHFQVENEINIFDNKVLIVSYEPKAFAIMMESSAVADTQRQIFEFLWQIVN